jgi:hypothetical protein
MKSDKHKAEVEKYYADKNAKEDAYWEAMSEELEKNSICMPRSKPNKYIGENE